MALMLCLLCNKEIGHVSNRLPHMKKDHPEQFGSAMGALWEARKAGAQARRQEARERKKRGNGTGQSPKAPPPLSTATVPAPGAIVFTLGQHKIEIDPSDLIECWMLCMDMKRSLGLKDEFTTILRDCVDVTYRQAMAQVVIFQGGVSVVKTQSPAGNGNSEEAGDG